MEKTNQKITLDISQLKKKVSEIEETSSGNIYE
jgi:hypothetical protein